MEDREIIDLYFARSERAIRETERKYGRQVQGVAYGILRNRADAEECAGDTWMRAWNAMPPQRPDRLGAWLMRVARNLSLDRLRRSGAMKRGETALALDELTEVVADVRDEADDGEIMAVVNGFLARQRQVNRVMFLRRYWYMDGVPEIARRVGRTEGAVRVTLYRMRKGLRAALEKEGIAI